MSEFQNNLNYLKNIIKLIVKFLLYFDYLNIEELKYKRQYGGANPSNPHANTSNVTSMQEIKFDEWRGSAAANEVGTALMNKDFAIAYDRIICLRDGEYTISASEYINASAAEGRREIKVNGSIAAAMYTISMNTNNVVLNPTLHLKRGDYVQYRGNFYANYGQFSIVRVR